MFKNPIMDTVKNLDRVKQIQRTTYNEKEVGKLRGGVTYHEQVVSSTWAAQDEEGRAICVTKRAKV